MPRANRGVSQLDIENLRPADEGSRDKVEIKLSKKTCFSSSLQANPNCFSIFEGSNFIFYPQSCAVLFGLVFRSVAEKSILVHSGLSPPIHLIEHS